MNKKAFSLFELLVAITIAAIIMAVGSSFLTNYVQKYNIEKETNGIFSDLISQRFQSITTGKSYGVMFDSDNYTLFKFQDSNYNMKFDNLSEMGNKKIKYLKNKLFIKDSSGNYSLASNNIVIFDKTGVARNKNWGFGGFTIRIGTGKTTSAKYNCVVISPQKVKESKCE